MSDLDDLLNSLNDPTPAASTAGAKQSDELDDVLNALNDMVEKKQAKDTPKAEDDLDDLLNSLDKPTTTAPAPSKPAVARPAAPQASKNDDLDDLINELNKPSATNRDELDDLLDDLNAPKQPAKAAAQKPKHDDIDDLLNELDNKPKHDELDDLLDGLNDSKPASKPQQKPSAPAAKKDELDDLLDDLNDTKPAGGRQAPMQAVLNEDPNVCAECGKPISLQRMTALGRSYHPECFVCKICKKSLGTDPFHNVENQPFCAACFVAKFAKVCDRCKKPITSNMINALGKSWHRECFTCTSCNEPFPTPSFFQKDNQPYCEKCFKEACAPKCGACDKAILGSSLMALGKKFHPECFVCNVCKCPFPRGQFYNMDGVPVCEEHYMKKNTAVVCGKCGKNIAAGGEFITAMGMKWHPEHFVCSFCVNPLTQDSFKQNGGKPYCGSCYDKLFG